VVRPTESTGKTRPIVLHRDDGDDCRSVEEHYGSPDRSSKNALSAGRPPGRLSAWNAA
jgi:hypothetical protein